MLSLAVGRQLEELILIRCSLLHGERLEFLDLCPDGEKWERLVDAGGGGGSDVVNALVDDGGLSAAMFRVRVDGAVIWFDIDCHGYGGDWGSVGDCIKVRGENMSRVMQESWKRSIQDKVTEAADVGGEFPLYQLLSLHLLPLLHEEVESNGDSLTRKPLLAPVTQLADEQIHHVLFTSHHLISPIKRKNLQHWSISLEISGFAKVGYPGIIYAQGPKLCIESFVKNVKAMQWLALKMRFVEPLEGEYGGVSEIRVEEKKWKEFEKVGEVVGEMRRLGREKYTLEMGIGAGARVA